MHVHTPTHFHPPSFLLPKQEVQRCREQSELDFKSSNRRKCPHAPTFYFLIKTNKTNKMRECKYKLRIFSCICDRKRVRKHRCLDANWNCRDLEFTKPLATASSSSHVCPLPLQTFLSPLSTFFEALDIQHPAGVPLSFFLSNPSRFCAILISDLCQKL